MPFFLVSTFPLFGLEISGKINSNVNHVPVIYFQRIENYFQLFEIENKLLLDSATLDSNGEFHLSTDFKSASKWLIRAHIRHKHHSPLKIIAAGREENYLFFEANSTNSIHLTGDARNFSKNWQILDGPAQLSFKTLRLLREPIYLAADEIKLTQRTPVSNRDSLNRALKKKIDFALLLVNQHIEQFIDTVSNPNVLFLAAAYFHFNKNEPGHLPVLRKAHSRLVSLNPTPAYLASFRQYLEIMDVLEEKEEKGHSYFFWLAGFIFLLALAFVVLLLRKINK